MLSVVLLEKTLESPLNSKEIKLVNPKGNQPRIFIGKTDAEAEVLILWHLMWRVASMERDTEKVPDTGKVCLSLHYPLWQLAIGFLHEPLSFTKEEQPSLPTCCQEGEGPNKRL